MPSNVAVRLSKYDRFVSAYNLSPRVNEVFQTISAPLRHWLVFPEYRIEDSSLPNTGTVIQSTSDDEAEVILSYFDKWPLQAGERICFDSTGFIRPHLLFLLQYLLISGCDQVDVIYSEPTSYARGSRTPFSAHLTEIRQVRGFEGCHTPDSDGEYFVLGCGYDTMAMHAIASHLKHSKKVQLFPFPPLRPHMYQENRLKTQDCQSAFGQVLDEVFAPGYDPFATANTLSRFVREHRSRIKNLYLTPLATKPQVIGFAWFYMMECIKEPVSIMYPFSNGYNQETSTGISEVWRFQLDFALLRKLQKSFRTSQL